MQTIVRKRQTILNKTDRQDKTIKKGIWIKYAVDFLYALFPFRISAYEIQERFLTSFKSDLCQKMVVNDEGILLKF